MDPKNNEMPLETAYEILRKLTRNQAVSQDMHDMFRISLETLYKAAVKADQMPKEQK